MVEKSAAAFLEKIELFRGLDGDEFELVLKNVNKKTYKPGKMKFKHKKKGRENF